MTDTIILLKSKDDDQFYVNTKDEFKEYIKNTFTSISQAQENADECVDIEILADLPTDTPEPEKDGYFIVLKEDEPKTSINATLYQIVSKETGWIRSNITKERKLIKEISGTHIKRAVSIAFVKQVTTQVTTPVEQVTTQVTTPVEQVEQLKQVEQVTTQVTTPVEQVTTQVTAPVEQVTTQVNEKELLIAFIGGKLKECEQVCGTENKKKVALEIFNKISTPIAKKYLYKNMKDSQQQYQKK